MAVGCSQSRSQHSNYFMAKTVLRGSAVLHAVAGHLRSPQTLDIVFGKETSLELVVIGEDGIVQSISEQSVFGIIKDIAILTWNDECRESTPQTHGRDLLVVLSDSGKLSFLIFCSEMHRFFALAHIQLSSPGNLRNQLGRMLAIDPTGQFVAVSAYDERFAVLSVCKSAGSNIVDEKITYPPENEGETSTVRDNSRTCVRGTIWSMCFIPSENKERHNPLLAVLMNRKAIGENQLILFECNLSTRSVHIIFRYSETGLLAHHISAVPHLSGFALLFRMGDVLLLDVRDPSAVCSIYNINLDSASAIEEQSSFEEPCRGLFLDDEGMSNVARALLELRDSGDDDPMNIDSGSENFIPTSKYVVSWCWEPVVPTNSKLVFCLDTGELQTLEICSEVGGVRVILSDVMRKGLPCSRLLWVEGGFIAGIVDMGNGMVFKLEDGRLDYRSSIENIAPILDLTVEDCPDDKQDQMYACCGMNPEGALTIIRNGISVDRLLRTAPIYQGITGTWTLRMKKCHAYHSFLVLSFVEETRVLSVGLSFTDVTDATGFQPDACTLACGLVCDGLLVQIYKAGVRLCLPTTCGHPEGIPLSAPVCTSWYPHNMSINSGAVGHHFIVVSTSNPCFLFILGVKSISAFHYEIYEIQHVILQHEVSCISIPNASVNHEQLVSKLNLVHKDDRVALQNKVKIGTTFVIGTHKPSVEILSFVFEEGLKVLAVGTIWVNNALGTPISGCIPEDVRLVSVERPYVLAGLRNGMLLRYEWPATIPITGSEQNRDNQFDVNHFSIMEDLLPSTKPPNSSVNLTKNAEDSIAVNLKKHAKDPEAVNLELIAVRRVGIAPVILVPLHDSLDADIIVLSDRPWLLHSARHSLVYTSISFQPATHATPVSSVDCPKGIFFVAENSLHLVEMVRAKRINVQKFSIGGTPRKVLYHHDSKTLLVMRIGLTGTCSSDICCVDPLSGSLLSKFSCEPGETAKCMQIVKVGNEKVLVVGTSQSAGRTVMASGEAESAKGRLIVLSLENAQRSTDSSSLLFGSNLNLPSQISSPFGEIVGYATEQLSSSSLCSSPDDISSNIVKLEEVEARPLRLLFQVQQPGAVLAVCPYLDRYFLASAGNNVNVFGFLNENPRRVKKFAMAKTRFAITCLSTFYSRIAVGDCRDGVLLYSYHEGLRKLEQVCSDPVHRLVADCALMDMETVVVSDRTGNISVLSCADHLEGNESPEKNLILNSSFYLGETVMSIRKGSFSYKLPVDDVLNYCSGAEVAFEPSYNSIVAGSLLGSVIVLIPVTRDEYELLEAVQARLVVHPFTSPILGNDHKEFRGRGPLAGRTMLDGNLLAQFLELTSMQQESVLAAKPETTCLDSKFSLSASRVVRVLERVNYALN